uniref:Cytochrome P450 n=1 Tax=Fagus sylvatica TaxID=28930 RepID=A0A2N9EUF5_FAGSY
MPTMAWTWIILALALLAYILQKYWAWKINNKKKKLPPGPRGFPIFGHLHMLGELPHQDLHKLAQKHGPIMHLRLGMVPAFVVSSPQAAELFLKTHDLVFASRPLNEFSNNIKINSFKSMRKEELDLLIKFIQGAARDQVAVDLSAKVSSLSADMSCRLVFGKKYMDEDFDERGFNSGLTKRMKAVSKIFDDFLEKIIDEHVQSKEKNKSKDFVDVMLGFMGSEESEYRIERPNIKAIILDMLAASMDTSATAIDWILTELIKHPRIMKKVQKELENMVGLERMVQESDLDSLEYLDIVVKETMRLHPVAPLLIPHEAMEDCTINGYHIPRKSRILINVWAIGRDPSVWHEPEKFFPERSCPGMQYGLTVVQLVVAQLVHCFDWELPNDMLPTELDMTEEFGLTTPRAQHLLVVPTYRLHK